jgi:hypothetical protein
MDTYPAEWTVKRALDAYLGENGFTVEAYDAKWTEASFLGIPFKVPNTKKHRWGIMLHDLHHVATGFGTDLKGEGEISAWEARGRFRGLGPYLTMLVGSGTLLGLLLCPRRAWRAFRSGGRPLFTEPTEYDALLAMSVGELRALLGLPRDGIASTPRRLHALAPSRG